MHDGHLGYTDTLTAVDGHNSRLPATNNSPATRMSKNLCCTVVTLYIFNFNFSATPRAIQSSFLIKLHVHVHMYIKKIIYVCVMSKIQNTVGCFFVVVCLSFKTSPGAKPFK